MTKRSALAALFAALLFSPPLRCAAAPDAHRYGRRSEVRAGDTVVTVLFLKGTPYQMGYAHGKLCAAEARHLARTTAPAMLRGLGKTTAEVDRIWAGYARHLRREYLEELRGLADGAGLTRAEVYRLHAMPDISEWHCTFFAAAPPASPSGVLQIRALDYETGAGIQRHPALIVCKPNRGVPFVNVGWLGMCGVVSGMNAAGIAMSEIGDDWAKATDSFDGRPLTYVMRDVVQFARSMNGAVSLVRDRPRTTSLLYCLSSGRERQICALQTSRRQCRVYSPANLPFRTRPGLVYLSMGMDSDWNQKVGNALLKRYGTLNVHAAQELMRTLKTGNLHAVVFRPDTGDLWVANATDDTMAFDRPYVRFSLRDALRDRFFRR